MDKTQFLAALANLSDVLSNLRLTGEASRQRDRTVESISDLASLITRNSLKEGTVALQAASDRLTAITVKANAEQQDLAKTTRNIQRVAGVLGAVAGVIRFV